MATFAKSTFSASSYAAFRPTWPVSIVDRVIAWHRGPKILCVDLGCGHGSFTRLLAPCFTKVVGIDPSARMVEQAASSTDKESNVSFRQGNAEDLSAFGDNSIDMAISSQAAHWFDYGKVWPMLSRKLRPGGTVAFLGYKENVFVGKDKATEVLARYCFDPNADLMGPYWEQPGRNILRGLYRDIIPPEKEFEDLERQEYESVAGQRAGDEGGAREERIMYKNMKLGEFEGYARTFSCYYRWLEAHLGREPRAEDRMSDIVDEMLEEILKIEPEWNARIERGDDWRDIEVECEWGSVVLLARRSVYIQERTFSL